MNFLFAIIVILLFDLMKIPIGSLEGMGKWMNSYPWACLRSGKSKGHEYGRGRVNVLPAPYSTPRSASIPTL